MTKAYSLTTGLIFVLTLCCLNVPHAAADRCATEGDAGGGFIELDGTCFNIPDGEPGGSGPNHPPGGTPSKYTAFKWGSVCFNDPNVAVGDVDCPAAFSCPDPRQRAWQLWGRLRSGSWMPVLIQCFGGPPPVYEPPTVTPGTVLNALRRVGLPELTTVVEPAEKTLVNFDTNFYTQPSPVSLTLTLLGQQVQVEATPVSYRWDFGDGTTATTSDPGLAYPGLAVTHRYTDARVTVHASVATTYTARFRVGGGGWRDVGGTVTATGPPTALRVAEATPLLSGDHG